MITCPNCTHLNLNSAVQCSQCYSPLPATLTCPNCGTEVRADASFCGQCGTPLGEAAQPAMEAQGEQVVSEFAQFSQGEPEPAQALPSTQAQRSPQQQAYLQHIETGTVVPLQANQTVVHIGKPNDRVPPDIDLSGFPHSEVVSRVHASIRIEGEAYYIEDAGSSNGTYVNNLPVWKEIRHRLRPGDRVAFGKEDKVSFLFQIRA